MRDVVIEDSEESLGREMVSNLECMDRLHFYALFHNLSHLVTPVRIQGSAYLYS